MEDIERMFEHLSSEEKKSKREEWLRAHYSKSNKEGPNTKGDEHEGNSRP